MGGIKVSWWEKTKKLKIGVVKLIRDPRVIYKT